ncbi:MAG: hypothetical protein U0744_19515 [Gemmataceae bacterium]
MEAEVVDAIVESVPEAESNHADPTVVEADAVEVVEPVEDAAVLVEEAEPAIEDIPIAAPIALSVDPDHAGLAGGSVAPAAPPIAASWWNLLLALRAMWSLRIAAKSRRRVLR